MKKLLVILLMLAAMNASAQWVQMSNGMGNKDVRSFASNGNYLFAGTINNGVYYSTNNGMNWTQTSLTNQQTYSLLINGNNIFAGNTYPPSVHLSTNNGANWSQTSLENQSVYSLEASGNSIIAGTLNYGIFFTTNNGANWIQTSVNNRTVLSLASSGNNVFAATYNNCGVYKSTNNGLNWSQTSLNDRSIWVIAANGNNVYAGTGDISGIYISTNNGTNWTQSLIMQSISALAVYGNTLFAGVSVTGFNVSFDNGNNWIQKNEGLGNLSTWSLFVSNGYLYAGTSTNGVYRRPLSELVGIHPISTETPSKYSLSQNYPNPFNPITNVKFSMLNARDVKLVVYDVMGREVQTLVNEKLSAGTYEVKFDGSMLNSGIYFYKMMTDGFTETKKMLMIK
jgi:hypothetical protein